MSAPRSTRAPAPTFFRALCHPAVWRRGAPIGLAVGVMQVVVNQGDHWIHHQIDATVIAKSILSPLLTLSVALASAAATHRELHRLRSS
jgi:hypothetical protein